MPNLKPLTLTLNPLTLTQNPTCDVADALPPAQLNGADLTSLATRACPSEEDKCYGTAHIKDELQRKTLLEEAEWSAMFHTAYITLYIDRVFIQCRQP